MEGAEGGSSVPSSLKTAVKKCGECDDPQTVVDKGKKSYCKGCWKHECEFKFRKKLLKLAQPPKGSSGLVYDAPEDVLIYYDGSPSAVANINLLLSAMLLNKKKSSGDKVTDKGSSNPKIPFPFTYTILVILQSDRNGSSATVERQRAHLFALHRWARAASVISGTDICVFVTSLEMALQTYLPNEAKKWQMLPPTIQLFDNNEDCQEKMFPTDIRVCAVQKFTWPIVDVFDLHLNKIRDSLKSKTDNKDFVDILKMNLLRRSAEEMDMETILLPENQTSLAVKQFTMMALGRGSQVAEEMAFTSTFEEVQMVRPLIDFTEDELISYLGTLDQHLTVGLLNPDANRKMKIDNVERQCDDFIVKLQKDYPATVSTLTKIGGKLEPPAQDGQTDDTHVRCQFCQRLSDAVSEELKLCYGCQHFLVDKDSDETDHFKQLFEILPE